MQFNSNNQDCADLGNNYYLFTYKIIFNDSFLKKIFILLICRTMQDISASKAPYC